MYQVQISTSKGTVIGNELISDPLCRIGKASDNHIVLHGWQVGKCHASLRLVGADVYLDDLGTGGGTRVNGQRIETYGPLSSEDVIEIHSYLIRIKPPTNRYLGANDPQGADVPAAATSAPHKAAVAASQSAAAEAGTVERPTSPVPPPAAAPRPPAAPETAAPVEGEEQSKIGALTVEWRRRLHKSLLEQMDLRRMAVNQMSHEALRRATEDLLESILTQTDLPRELSRAALKKQVVDEAVGLGPLEELIEDEDVSEIMVNAADQIFYERAGKLEKSRVTFTDDQAVLAAIERIVSPLGRRIDESSPMVDARLRDGSRVNAVIPPLALKGPCITIRKFMKERLTIDRLVGFGSMNDAMAGVLRTAVLAKRNVVISGGTGSGKTTLLNVLSGFIPFNERVVTVEDAAELQLPQPNLVALEARPPNQEGKGEVRIRDLVKNCLRMRPDRIVVGECRGGEALDMLQAMNTGHDGSLTTAHANSPRDCIARLEVMVMMAGMDLPSIAIREQIASAVNLIVQQTRFSCGQRKVTSIAEVTGVEGGRVQLAEIFRFQQTGYDERGRVQGRFEATGLVPEFYEKLRARGERVDLSIFDRVEEGA
ncbi:MAG: ATPase, T2SS/T4P/T4SS family [Lysobacterales bacterium]